MAPMKFYTCMYNFASGAKFWGELFFFGNSFLGDREREKMKKQKNRKKWDQKIGGERKNRY